LAGLDIKPKFRLHVSATAKDSIASAKKKITELVTEGFVIIFGLVVGNDISGLLPKETYVA